MRRFEASLEAHERLRLAERMASASFQQTEAKLEADLAVLRQYLSSLEQWANRQAGHCD